MMLAYQDDQIPRHECLEHEFFEVQKVPSFGQCILQHG